MHFYHNGKYYRLTFAIKDSDKVGPNGEDPFVALPDETTVRGESLIGLVTMER